MAATLTLPLCDQTVVLHADGALFWQEARALIVADAHFGKAQVFREGGIPLPAGTTAHDLARLSTLAANFRPAHLLFLGDLMHGPLSAPEDLDRQIRPWRRRHADLRLHLVGGNHDRRAGDPPSAFRFDQVAIKRIWPPFVFTHHPAAGGRGYGMAGHLHPAVTLRGRGRQKETLPCFWFRENGVVLPAFGSFTGNQVIRPGPGDRVYVIAGEAVLPV